MTAVPRKKKKKINSLNKNLEPHGDGLVGKAVAVQAQGLEFDTRDPSMFRKKTALHSSRHLQSQHSMIVRGRGRRIGWKFLGLPAWSMLRGRKNRNPISTSGR